ncbi:MAG: Rrf2 family transcriptional regulator [Segetibacter sp.]|nr:Rrf2 family transcriptional regulator [Segetibacter sp.]
MLSKKTKYAINALVYLAKGKPGEAIQISRIAESENISRKFLEAILLVLRNAGLLASKKGMAGGYYLQKNPEDINIAEVVRLFEGAIALLPCVAHKYYQRCEECKDEATCGIRDVFAEIRNKTVDMLKGATLKNIVEREHALLSHLKTKEPII